MEPSTIIRRCVAEAAGTFILVFLGTGAVFAAALTGALQGLFQVAIVWGIAVALAIHTVGAVSGAHLNPAVTIGLALCRGFPARWIAPYVASQVLGAFLASCVLYGLFAGVLAGYEREHGIIRGQSGSQRSAMVFGEYAPNPAAIGVDAAALEQVSLAQAFAAEFLGTALLLAAILALTDEANALRPPGALVAPAIGLTLTALICILGPLTQAGFNPARDFGPRLVRYLAGWGTIAIPGPRGEFFIVYILAPVLGAGAAASIHRLAVGRPDSTVMRPPRAASRD